MLPQELRAFLTGPRPLRISIARDVLMDLGLRVSELCAANVGDLLEMGGRTYLAAVVKGGHPVHLPISPDVAEGLKDWLLSRNMPDPGEPLLLNMDGQRFNRHQLAYVVTSIGLEAGVKRFEVTPHVLRHMLNIIRRRAQLDPMVRSGLLTHSSLSSLISYEHVVPDELVTAREKQREGLQAYPDGEVMRTEDNSQDSA